MARIHAARAVVDMRIPIPTGHDHQLAWITRASVAQPAADTAQGDSQQFDADTRLLALLSWRTTHRAPRHREQRREISTEALDLTQRLRIPGRQVDSAAMLAVDSLESGDRAQFDCALSVLRWVAERDGNRRLHWHTFTVAAGISFMDGDVESAERYRVLAREAGMAVGSPGWFGADLMLVAQSLLASGDLEQIRAAVPTGDSFEWENPIGRAVVAHFKAMLGEREIAERHVRVAMRQVDEEASMLLLCALLADAAFALGLIDVMDDLTDILQPYSHHVAVDSNAWWCEGPVSLTLATLAHGCGDDDAAAVHLAAAASTARSIGDARSLARIAGLSRQIAPSYSGAAANPRSQFTDRELQVLRMIIDGRSNPENARALSYSPSTIRNDASAVYRKLGVKTRAEAAARAIALGLV
ncbi:MAG: LuxR C-terminal-related transcriptional regulator [Ilumatobacteraceae bacterium]